MQKCVHEELPLAPVQGWRLRAPGYNSAGAAQRSFPTSEVRGGGREELPHFQGQGRRARGATTHPRSGPAAERSNPISKERLLQGHRRAERSYSTFKVRRGGCEKIPLVQGKEQQLQFAGAAVKRYPTSKVRETQVRL
ncbi:unnamed protein product [Rangifer tarandus platyrhynchus]|uniref:Uncharacterized protein n=1 Tax=Rangifer tarandus platyrhynchus TaxID=3082113 RepID=A0ABN9A3J5_RANTA|nr:unnamed protein product [Rangifer tarandus platyrhynchus]